MSQTLLNKTKHDEGEFYVCPSCTVGFTPIGALNSGDEQEVCDFCGKPYWQLIVVIKEEQTKMTLGEFIKTKCEGRIYDSCVNTPCRWSSSGGCMHPDHPKFQPVTRTATDDWDEPQETASQLSARGC